MKPDWRSLPDGYAVAINAFAEGVRPPPDWTVSQWADEKRRLSSETSKEFGQWHTSRVPLAREIMDALSPNHPCHTVAFMASRQVSKTEIGINWMGHHGDMCKGPAMCAQPSVDPLAERFSKTRLAPMIEACDSLKDKFGVKSRDGNNTLFLKKGPGVIIGVCGANSAASLRQLPIKKLFGDEIDEYPLDIENQGDPIEILKGAMTTFPDRKVYLCSSPTVESLSRINREFKAGDQRHYHVPCPHCHEAGEPHHGLQVLAWENLVYPENHPEQAQYRCAHCAALIDESHKPWMLQEEGYGGYAKWIPKHPERTALGRLSYHANGLYASVGLGYTWGELATQYEKAKHDPVALKTFINVRLGLCFEDPNEKLDHEAIMARCEGWKIRTIPRGCLAMTGGVDIHKTHFRCLKLGHGRNGAAYFLDYARFEGDPTNPADWQQVENWMNEPLLTEQGVEMRVEAYGVDAGYLIEDVLNYTTPRKYQGVFAVKGASNPGRPVIAKGPGKVEFSWPKGSPLRHGGEVWSVGGDTVTEQFYLRLKTDADKSPDKRLIHFPGRANPDDPGTYLDGFDEEFYLELTAEVYDPRKGKYERTRDNHAHDCYRYAMAASRHPRMQIHHWSEAKWRAQEARYWPPVDLFSQLDPSPSGRGQGEGESSSPPLSAPIAQSSPAPQTLTIADLLRQRLLSR